ncbi:AT-rich interactive domain-containing protein 1 isoform X1 [Pistacia vera]|uniref:AT-rich interactive domain-containing protein 1 isoform X1 n=3 Tax=Pistacia vera TaxID=55513 RepID=UPI0012631E8B|nr:AT-rich interactive domain-containing protein 1 isoform X1 [Pistacia vera]XP_031275790.1 AT-rich interactive domain-containing protein 1 isoform X1 [Pistacia vera]
MAGWSMVANGSVVDCGQRTSKQKNLEAKGLGIDFEPSSEESKLKCKKLRLCFDQFLRFFLKQIYAQDSLRPLPPMLKDGQPIDLLKLFLVVREKGGYDKVSTYGLWDLVAKESGLGLSASVSIKLVYAKYLDALERWLDRVADDRRDSKSNSVDTGSSLSGYLMKLGAEFEGFLSGSKKTDEVYPHLKELDFENDVNVCRNDLSMVVESKGLEKCINDEGTMHIGPVKRYVDAVEVVKFCDDGELKSTVFDLEGDKNSFDFGDSSLDDADITKCALNLSDSGEQCNDEEAKSVVVGESDGGKNCADSDKDGIVMLDSKFVEEKEESSSCHEKKEERSSRKRKHGSTWKMLSWITGIAMNPCNSVVGSLPDKSKWKSYGNGELWKQVLSYREAVFFKRHVDSSVEQSPGQKNQKMHPCLYDDHAASSYNLRERLNCSQKHLLGKTSQAQACSQSLSTGGQNGSSKGGMENRADKELLQCTDSSTRLSVFDYDVEKPIPIGPGFQAEVPEWTGVPSESDVKWLGTRVWPLEKVEHRFLIERDRIGKGRQDSCGCQFPASIECVRFHIAEKRYRLKLELSSAFHKWKIDKMGEEVMLSWTEQEQKKFKNIVRLNPPSLDKCFWDQIFKFFPAKSREELVSYYFNVFLLQRRALQNRSNSEEVDSDDDYESELVTNSFVHETMKSASSIFHSPNKKHKRSR